MNEFDEYLKKKASEEPIELPDSVKARIEQSLAALPERVPDSAAVPEHFIKSESDPEHAAEIKIGHEASHDTDEETEAGHAHKAGAEPSADSKPATKPAIRWFSRLGWIVASLVFVGLVLLPNLSAVYARALESIPVIGGIVRVVTVRNYFYSDPNHEMDIDVPYIESESGAADYINADVEELTDMLRRRFDEELDEIGGLGHSSVYVDYEVVTNSDSWFTLRLRVHEAAGSSNTYYRYYHIDKLRGKIVCLGDLAADESFYGVIEDEIRRQMRERMAADPDSIYWVDDAEIGQDFVKLSEKSNFYWNTDGDLVIVFDKYEVAPGSMGTPEFDVPRSVIGDVLAPDYR